MQVQEIMKAGIQVCHPEDTLADATTWMWKAGSDSLPVIDWNNRILGQISGEDVQAALANTGRSADEFPVGEAMSHDVKTCSPEDKIQDVLHSMRESGSTWVPVVDSDRKLLGVFSTKGLP